MPSLARGESSTDVSPVLDLFTAIGAPPVPTDVAELAFRIFDISTPAKRGAPVQVFPTAVGTFFTLDPTTAPPTGHRLGVGHYFAPYTVPLDEPIGDHKVEWEFKRTVLSPAETFEEEFFVKEGASPAEVLYCGITDLREEGFLDPPFTDARILSRIALATRYVDKMTGRWFSPRTFDASNRFLVDGKAGLRALSRIDSGSRTLHLEIPIIRIDKVLIEQQGLLDPGLTEIDPNAYRVYNRHLSGLTQPDDRENPRIAFIQTRAIEFLGSGLFPAPAIFPQGRQNVHLEGVFGYTDPDGSPLGETPILIRQATCRLAARDLLLDSDACEKFNLKVKFRIKSDKEGSTTVTLQDLWLKGAFTGDPEIDNVLMAYKRPPRMAAV